MPFRDNGEWYDGEYVQMYPWCPDCDPEGQNVREPYEMAYCNDHRPFTAGTADLRVGGDFWLSGSAEAGGQDNSSFCKMIHRQTD